MSASYKLKYSKLLTKLYFADYEWTIPNDANRADDGMNLRYIFSQENDYPEAEIESVMAQKQCSMLEMMVALVIRCESDYLGYPDDINHKTETFITMLTSLGLANMINDNYNDGLVEDVLYRFMSHQYTPAGNGSLFTVPNSGDLRNMELWDQMNCWINQILNL